MQEIKRVEGEIPVASTKGNIGEAKGAKRFTGQQGMSFVNPKMMEAQDSKTFNPLMKPCQGNNFGD